MREETVDERFMREAIAAAEKGDPRLTSPNPRVGAVIVEAGAVVARGHFERDGGPHAEKIALAVLGRRPKPEASLFVTLEPCSTEGRTGACTHAILEAGIKRVVIGATDPTPEHGGRAVQLLRLEGVEVIMGVLDSECQAVNPGFRGRSTARHV